jgi:hypothetical protein
MLKGYMNYIEKNFFFRRTIEVGDDAVRVSGSGLLNPTFSAIFSYSDLSPNPLYVKAVNRFLMIPLIFFTAIDGFALTLLARIHDLLPDYILAFILISLVTLCVSVLSIMFIKFPYVVYKTKAGVDAFAVGKGFSSKESFARVCECIAGKITSEK